MVLTASLCDAPYRNEFELDKLRLTMLQVYLYLYWTVTMYTTVCWPNYIIIIIIEWNLHNKLIFIQKMWKISTVNINSFQEKLIKEEINDIENKMKIAALEKNCFSKGYAYSPGNLCYFWIRQYPCNSLTFARHNILAENSRDNYKK